MCELFTLSEAIQYGENGRIEEWIHSFLSYFLGFKYKRV